MRSLLAVTLVLVVAVAPARAASGASKGTSSGAAASTFGVRTSGGVVGYDPASKRSRRAVEAPVGLGSAVVGSRPRRAPAPAPAPTAGRLVRVATTPLRARPEPIRGVRVVVPMAHELPKLSSQAPGLLFVLADDSGSMAGNFAGTRGVSKADAVADVVNRMLSGFVNEHNVGGVIKDRLHVLVRGYNRPVLPSRSLGIARLSAVAADAELDTFEDGEGQTFEAPTWARATAHGGTPMTGAFRQTAASVRTWLGSRRGGPPLVLGLNVTDGRTGDGYPDDELEELADDVGRAGGALLMTNIHLSSSPLAKSVIFPDEAEARTLDANGRRLFEMSSPVPPALAEKLGTKPGARMMAYNTTVEAFERVFVAGSSVAAR